MIGEKERFHGVVLSRIVTNSEGGIQLKPLRGASHCCYAVGGRNAIMVKYSTNRLSPWQFVVAVDHCSELRALRAQYEQVLLVLACGPDGIVALDWDLMDAALPPTNDSCTPFCLQVKRRKREQYRVSGLWCREFVAPDASFAGAWLV